MKQGTITEKWKFISGYKNIYKISSWGRVMNYKTGRILKHSIDSRGFHKIKLWKDGKSETRLIHKLVAEHFINGEEVLERIAFLDCDKDNLNVNNLQYCTRTGQSTLKEIHLNKFRHPF